jgi:excisionase family DNA binding protein
MTSKLLKVKQVADILGVSKALIYDMIKKNELPCIRFRMEMRVREEDLEVFLLQSRKGDEMKILST